MWINFINVNTGASFQSFEANYIPRIAEKVEFISDSNTYKVVDVMTYFGPSGDEINIYVIPNNDWQSRQGE